MRDEYDFSDAVKNPFAGKFKNGYKIIVHHNSPGGGWDETIEVTPDEVVAANIKREEYKEHILKNRMLAQ
jgi:hypothetical protein